jgi:integrase/recombinase XerD
VTRLSVTALSKDIADFLAFKRALGFSYRRSEATLRSFERFARSQARNGAMLDLGRLIRTWLVRIPGRKPVTLACDLGAVCHRPAYWSQAVIGMSEPVDDRRNGARA